MVINFVDELCRALDASLAASAEKAIENWLLVWKSCIALETPFLVLPRCLCGTVSTVPVLRQATDHMKIEGRSVPQLF